MVAAADKGSANLVNRGNHNFDRFFLPNLGTVHCRRGDQLTIEDFAIGKTRMSHSKGRYLSCPEEWTGTKKHRATLLASRFRGRGLVPIPSPPKTANAAIDSFRWIVRPEGSMLAGEIYPDGSALDGPNPELMRCGWAFVVICFETGEVIASAMGVPPPWITDIGGAEAWLMLQGAFKFLPGKRSRFKGDCKSCIDVVHAGLAVASSPKRALARVYGLLLPTFEDTCLRCVLWMLAHKSEAHVGRLKLSNGDLSPRMMSKQTT